MLRPARVAHASLQQRLRRRQRCSVSSASAEGRAIAQRAATVARLAGAGQRSVSHGGPERRCCVASHSYGHQRTAAQVRTGQERVCGGGVTWRARSADERALASVARAAFSIRATGGLSSTRPPAFIMAARGGADGEGRWTEGAPVHAALSCCVKQR